VGVDIQGFLSRRLISTGHAKKMLLVLDSEEQRMLLARRIINDRDEYPRSRATMSKSIRMPFQKRNQSPSKKQRSYLI
jgi:hypothetical protein